MNNYVGGYWILNALPIWVTAGILFLVTIGVIFILRDRCEGLFYNTSYSAMLGDGALLVVVLMIAGILQRGIHLPESLQSGLFHVFVAAFSIILGVAWWNIGRPKQWGDTYHHLVIAPLLFYLLLTLLPVIWTAGTHLEKWATLSLILFWAIMVIYDIKTDRLDQRNYLYLGKHLEAIWMERWHSS